MESNIAEMGEDLASVNRAGISQIIDLTREATDPVELDPSKLYGKENDQGRFEIIDPTVYLDNFADEPKRVTGVVAVSTVESLIAYVDRHRDESENTVWVHPTSGAIVAVLNDHDGSNPAGARWGDHRAELNLLETEEWKHWIKQDGNLMGQEDFAEHLEDGVRQIVEPEAATMLEIAQSFHASTQAQFRSGHRLSDGRIQLQYDEEVQATAGEKGELEIPTEFKLALPPFVGEDPYSVTARLRYRVQSGTLKIGYRLEQPEAIVRDCLNDIAEKLRDRYADAVFVGSPR